MLVVWNCRMYNFNGSRGRSGRIHCQDHGVRHTHFRRGVRGAIQLALIFSKKKKNGFQKGRTFLSASRRFFLVWVLT